MEMQNKSIFFVAIADLARGMVGQLISSCWRAGECAKDWMSKHKPKTETKPKQTKPQHHPEPKRTSSKLSETVKLRFRTSPDLSVPLHDDIGISRK